MSLKEAIAKRRAELGFTAIIETETVEVTEQAETADPLASVLTEEQRVFLNDYKAKLESDPKIQQLRRDLVCAAVEQKRKKMGF